MDPVVTFEHALETKGKGSDMPANRILLGLAISIACCLTAQGPAFSQENRGTFEQQLACTPDVWRLCGDRIPDVDRIVACLRQNTPQLSGPCRAVFDSNASVPQPAAPQPVAPRRRGAPPPIPDDDQ